MADRKHCCSGLNRREFLTGTAGATLGLSSLGGISSAMAAEAGAGKRTPTDLVPLGKTGIQISRAGIGTGTRGYHRQSNQTKLGFEKFVGLLRHAFDSGVRFFDLADLYGSHVYVREALRFIPRDKVTILTKIWWRWGESPKTVIERFLNELGDKLDTGYLDIVLLHCMTDDGWDKSDQMKPYMDMLSEMKAKKKVRAVGASCHKLEALQTAANSDWVDVVLARINPKGVKMDGPPEKVIPVLKQAKANGKGVLGMKIYGEGQLVDMREESLRFVWGLGCVDAITVGYEKPEHIDNTLELMGKVL
ncbi:MAG: aldo/keto reductase [Phycisphaerae bacterium]|nr:aldo/keto reductase [Phycisphaerae bacterium]